MGIRRVGKTIGDSRTVGSRKKVEYSWAVVKSRKLESGNALGNDQLETTRLQEA